MSDATESASGPQIEPGALVAGRYRVRREIARGAMGIVLEAHHEALLEPRAVKLLTAAAMEWPTGRPRLVREGRVLARCAHPHVVGIHDAGTCERHGPFLALEMIEGRSLESYLLARGRLETAIVARLGAQLASGLARIHTLGFVHRDVKPSNVLLARSPETSSHDVKLIDFGIACPIGITPSEKLTVAGELLGTVAYMAPELLVHEAPASPASDVYALAAMLYECLTGELPYPGRPLGIITAHVSGRAPADLSSQLPALPRGLAEVLMRSLGAEASARPALDELRLACGEASGAETALDLHEERSDAVRRQHVRAPYSAPARLIRGERSDDGRTEDISEGGALVVGTAECKAQEPVALRFPLPSSGRVVTVRGTASWVKARRGQCVVGVQFSDLPEEARREIALYVEIMTRGRPDEGHAQALWSQPPP